MTEERWYVLMYQSLPIYKLTEEEKKEGWHFCPDWDFLLIGPGNTAELECCTCKITKKEISGGV